MYVDVLVIVVSMNHLDLQVMMMLLICIVNNWIILFISLAGVNVLCVCVCVCLILFSIQFIFPATSLGQSVLGMGMVMTLVCLPSYRRRANLIKLLEDAFVCVCVDNITTDLTK